MSYIEFKNEACDAECRGANRCHGHAECARCGKVFCGNELNAAGLCIDCEEAFEAEEAAKEAADGDESEVAK